MSLAEKLLMALSVDPNGAMRKGTTETLTVENSLDFGLKTVPNLLHYLPGKKILDYGCGPGFQAVAMIRKGAREVVGVDINPTWVHKAKKLVEESGCSDKVSIHDADFFTANPAVFCEGFDVVVSFSSFEHFPNPEQEMQNMKECTKEGGKILITFAEPWYSHSGSHMAPWCKLPWVNLFFLEKTVMAVRAQYWHDGATRYSEVESGLNRMSLAKFERIISRSGLQLEFLKFYPTMGLPLVDKIPLVRELLVSAATAILSKRSPMKGAKVSHQR